MAVAGRDDCAELIQAFGCSVSHVLTDPSCLRFSTPDLEGVIPYRRGLRCAVAIGEPVCHPSNSDELARRFQRTFAHLRWTTVFAVVGEAFAERCIARGYGAIEFAVELIFDPRRDPLAGSRGRSLRASLHRAERAGVVVEEFLGCDPVIEGDLEQVGRSWLSSRRGWQAFITPIILFSERRGRRWFYARTGRRVVGVLSLVRLDSRNGYAFDHVLPAPEAPPGTSEIMVAHALRILGREDCSYATFGPSPLRELGRMQGVGRYGRAVSRAFFNVASRFLHFDLVLRYRRKFLSSRREPKFILFAPPHVGLREATSLLRAFHVSWRA